MIKFSMGSYLVNFSFYIVSKIWHINHKIGHSGLTFSGSTFQQMKVTLLSQLTGTLDIVTFSSIFT